MTHEELQSKINEGTTANLGLTVLEPIFKKREVELLASLKSCFRTGQYSELVLACHVAQLVALDDLKEQLNAIKRTGESSFQQIQEGLNDGGE